MSCLQDGDNTFGPQFCSKFDFTLLFEQSCFQIPPCAMLLLCLPLRIPQLHTQDIKIIKNKISGSKIAAILFLTATQLALLICWGLLPSFRTKASVPATALSFSASLALLYLSTLEHTRSVRPSSIINIYTLFSLLLDTPQARTLWIRRFPMPLPAIFIAGMALKALVLFLEARSKRKWLLHPYRVHAPEILVSIYNRTVLWWLNPLFLEGYQGIISFDRLFSIDKGLASSELERKFFRHWRQSR
jgi:ATP-binding cassette subfamily C (CFTR/MRP) protein 1